MQWLQATLLSFYEGCVTEGGLKDRVQETYLGLWKGATREGHQESPAGSEDMKSEGYIGSRGGIFLVQNGVAEVRPELPFASEVRSLSLNLLAPSYVPGIEG